MVKATGLLFNARTSIIFDDVCPPVINHPGAAKMDGRKNIFSVKKFHFTLVIYLDMV